MSPPNEQPCKNLKEAEYLYCYTRHYALPQEQEGILQGALKP